MTGILKARERRHTHFRVRGFPVAAKQLCLALAGFLLGRSTLFGALPSFAIALAAAMPSNLLLSAMLGSMTGCVLSSRGIGYALTGAASIAAAAAINRAASTLLKTSESSTASSCVAFVCCAATGATIQLADVFTLDSAIYYLCEAVLSGGAAYFFSRSVRLVPFFKSSGSMSAAEVASISISICVLLFSMADISFALIVPARALAVFVILIFANVCAETGGSIAGICAGVSLQLACGMPGLSGSYAIAGLLAGLFAVLGQTASSLVFVSVTGLYCVLTSTPESVAVLTEAAVAASLFIALPRRSLSSLKHRFARVMSPVQTDDSGGDVALSLKAVSAALRGVASSVRSVARAHGENGESATVQFLTAADILKDIACQTDSGTAYLLDGAARAGEALRSFGVNVTDISCRRGKNGRISLTALADCCDKGINKAQLAAYVGRACGCSMCIPSLRENGDGYILSFSQSAGFRVRVGACQSASGNNEYCGDYYELFCDGRGRQLMILSDGMGTGGKAAVDAAMTAGLFSQLITAGAGFECALRVVNSALLSKSGEESLATLDVTSIDLYTGKTEFYKAGGAATFVRKKGRTAALELSALPAGILKDVSFEMARARLSRGDIIVMVSDGVTDNGDKWLTQEIENYTGESAQELAEIIEHRAQKRHADTRCDDITVLCAIIE